jgi:iron(III) transport system substrate-binding protein
MKLIWTIGAAALFATSLAQAQTLPENYPADYTDLVTEANAEGSLLIYTNLSGDNLNPIIEAFNAAYPEIAVESIEMGPAEAFTRYQAETGTGVASADLIIANSITDWISAVERGMLDDYVSPETANMPAWSYPEPGLYTISTDPMVTIYNKITVPEDLQLSSMEDYFTAITENPDVFEGKVGTYDGRYAFGGAIGYAFARYHGDPAWDWFESAGPLTRPGGGAGGMIERTLSGELSSSFFVSGPVVFNRLRQEGLGEVLGWTFPSDGTPVFLRGMGITADAPHPAAAKVFLDFVLSEDGQHAVAAGNLTPYRPGVTTEDELSFSLDEVVEAIGGPDKMILIDYDPAMVRTFDAFTVRWGEAFNM